MDCHPEQFSNHALFAHVHACAGNGTTDLQVRMVPALSLDADGVGSYVIYGKLKEQGRKWPTGLTFQLLGIRPKCVKPPLVTIVQSLHMLGMQSAVRPAAQLQLLSVMALQLGQPDVQHAPGKQHVTSATSPAGLFCIDSVRCLHSQDRGWTGAQRAQTVLRAVKPYVFCCKQLKDDAALFLVQEPRLGRLEERQRIRCPAARHRLPVRLV